MSLTLVDLLPRLLHCQGAVRLGIGADALWALVGDLRSPVVGAELVDHIDLDGTGEGSTRVMHMKTGETVFQRIEVYDPGNRLYAYRALDVGIMGFCNHLGVARVTPSGVSHAVLSWTTFADPVGENANEIKSLLQNNIDTIMMAMSKRFPVH